MKVPNMETAIYKRSKTTDFFYKINLVVYIFGLPNFWIEDLKLSKKFVKFYNKLTTFTNVLINLLIFLELVAFFTHNNLTQKQKSNRMVFGISHPMAYSFYVIMANLEKKIRAVIYSLAVDLKEVYNDPDVEKQMISSTSTYLFALVFSSVMAMVLYTVDAGLEVIRYDMTFTTVITAYPDIEDRSDLANVMRAICCIVWWILFARLLGVFILVIALTTCLSHQYKNLQSYFVSLGEIFERDISQTEKEDQYEAAFKVGIKLHSDTLRCTQQTQTVCRGVFSGQIIFNICLLVVLMAQMVNSERTLVNLCATVFTASVVLISTGFYMWNAGDVTVEASHLATAMYFSGWYHCQGQSSVRLRNLVVISMANAQHPVVLKGLGYIDLSYESYIKIVKSSYSVFSVLF